MLPEPRDVGEPDIDHLDLVVFDPLEKILRALALVMHPTLPFLLTVCSANAAARNAPESLRYRKVAQSATDFERLEAESDAI
jgi:hypothetical protein